MEKETLDITFDVIKQKDSENNTKIFSYYESINEQLTDICNTKFVDMNSGYLTVFPMGDFLTKTFYDNSLIEFLVIYKTDRENVNFGVVYEKITKKGKKKISTYQSLVNGGNPERVSGTMQAEDVAERLCYYLKSSLQNAQKFFQKRNEIMIKLSSNFTCKIKVVYDCDYENHDLRERNINKWNFINPLKYFENYDKKTAETHGKFEQFVKLFKAMELELLLANETSIIIGKNSFVENFLYNVPSKLYNFSDNQVVF
ncbi:MAG: hypothetical protein KBT30_00405, partial [Clostridiales bacterium]|nr:hypothetical protein [Candidatus Apopatousia equi]